MPEKIDTWHRLNRKPPCFGAAVPLAAAASAGISDAPPTISICTAGIVVAAVVLAALLFCFLTWRRCARLQRSIADGSGRSPVKTAEMLRLLVDSLPIQIFIKDINDGNRYVFANKALCDFFQLPEEQVLGRSNFELFGIDDAEKVRALDISAAQSVKSETEQTAHLTDKSGKLRAFRLVKRRYSGKDGSQLILGSSTEITELEAEQSRAEENTEWFRRTLNAIGDGIITTDANGNILLMNPVAERMTGVKSADALGMPHERVFKITGSNDGRPIPSPVTRTLRTGNIVELSSHTDLIDAAGKRHHIADSSAPIRDRNGAITGAILVFRDITEEHLQRDQLKTALNGLEYAAELSHSAYFSMTTKDRKLLASSREFKKLWPVRDGVVVPVEEFVHPKDVDSCQKAVKALLDGNTGSAVFNYRAMSGGEQRNYQIRATLDNSNAQNPALVGVIQDITELTRKERQLDDTLKLWDLVLNAIPVTISVKAVDNDFRYAIFNKSFERFMGRSHEELIGKNDAELFASRELFLQLRDRDEEIVRKNQPVEFFESPYNADGRQLHFRTTMTPFSAADGQRLLLCVSVDITRETLGRQALEKLRNEQNELLEHHEFLLKAMPFYAYILDADDDFRYIYCNAACAASLGRPVDEIIGKNDRELFRSMEDAERNSAYNRGAMNSHDMREDVQSYTDADGMRHIVRAFRKSLKLSDGRNWLLGMMTDITELSELTQNQQTLNACFDAILSPGADSVYEIVRRLCLRLEAARGYLIRFDEKNSAFVPEAEYHSASGELKPVDGQAFPSNIKLYGVLTRDGIVRVPDVTAPEAVEQLGLWNAKNLRFGVKSLFCALVRVNDRPWGYIAVTYDKTPRRLSELECDFLAAGAHLTGLMLERKYFSEQQAATIDELRDYKQLMEYGTKLTRSGVFRLNPITLDICGSAGLNELFPLRDGKAAAVDEWIATDDIPDIRRKLDLLYSGREQQVTCSFRSDYFGSQRNYRILLSRSEISDNIVYFGAIQDITEITRQSEKFHRTMELWNLVLGLIPVMIFAKRADDDFRYTLANKAFEQFSGKAQDEIVGHTDAELFGRPQDVDRLEEADKAVMRSTVPQTMNESAVGADGEIHTFRTTKLPFTDADGRPLLLASCVDVTELNSLISNLNVLHACLEIFFKAENIPEAIHQVLKNIAEHMGADYAYVLSLDFDRNTCSTVMDYGTPSILSGMKDRPFNPSEPSMQYLSAGQDCFLTDLNAPEQRAVLSSWADVFERFDMRSIYFCGIRQSSRLWGDLGVVYTRKPHKITDLTRQFLCSAAHLIEMLLERDLSAGKLRAALEQAQAAEHAKSMFLASMSHEIRTPLNAVIGFSELLKNGSLTPNEQQEYLSGVFSSGNALLELINDVLDLSKLEAGQMILSPEALSFDDLVAEVIAIFKMKCAARNIYLRSAIAENMPTMYLDKLRLRQILFNLIGNAVKFTEQGGVTVQAGFERKDNNRGTLVFHVIDTGCGIPTEDQHKLFQLFVQGSAMRGHRGDGGTGLGLAICRRLVKQMNGTIELQSEPGCGTDFTVTLHNIIFAEAEIVARPAPDVKRTATTNAELHALLVDDVPMNLKVMSAMLKKLGVATTLASGGSEALAALHQQSFDFLLTDMWMPEMSGAELAASVRRGGIQSAIPIFAVTADIEANANFPLHDFSGVLLKPITIEKLEQVIALQRADR